MFAKPTIRSPLVWFGGKGMQSHILAEFIPHHRTYVEVFGGGASLLFRKDPSEIEVYNDIYSDLVNFFRVLRDPVGYERMRARLELTPYAREEYQAAVARLPAETDPVERATLFFIGIRQAFSGCMGEGWSLSVTESKDKVSASVARWLKGIENLEKAHARLRMVQVENNDWRKILKTYDTPDTFFYLDPPYVHSTRKSGEYLHELTDADHAELIEKLLGIKGKAVLSGYRNPIYAPLEAAGWRTHAYAAHAYAAAHTGATRMKGAGSASKRQARTETIWISPTCGERMQVNLFPWFAGEPGRPKRVAP